MASPGAGVVRGPMWECLKPSLYWWAEGFSGPVWCCGLSSDTDSTCFKRQWELFLMPGGCHPPDSLKLYWVDSLFLPSSGLRVSGSRPGSEKTSSCVVLGCTLCLIHGRGARVRQRNWHSRPGMLAGRHPALCPVDTHFFHSLRGVVSLPTAWLTLLPVS